jgi:RNase P subunit RPR2
MIDQGIRARARYLDESAHLLARTSPAISRQLRSQMHTLATDYNIDLPNTQKREACGACGNIMIPGQTSRTYLDNKRSKRSSKRHTSRRPSTGNPSPQKQIEEAAVKAMCYECLICNRVTRQVVPAPSKASRKEQEQIPPSKGADVNSRKPDGTHIPTDSGLGSPASSITNASSRRRAKTRKESGLQALLAKRKEESRGGGFATGFGLDLMDLMKTA